MSLETNMQMQFLKSILVFQITERALYFCTAVFLWIAAETASLSSTSVFDLKMLFSQQAPMGLYKCLTLTHAEFILLKSSLRSYSLHDFMTMNVSLTCFEVSVSVVQAAAVEFFTGIKLHSARRDQWFGSCLAWNSCSCLPCAKNKQNAGKSANVSLWEGKATMILICLDRGVVYPQSNLCASSSTGPCLGDSDFWAP